MTFFEVISPIYCRALFFIIFIRPHPFFIIGCGLFLFSGFCLGNFQVQSLLFILTGKISFVSIVFGRIDIAYKNRLFNGILSQILV